MGEEEAEAVASACVNATPRLCSIVNTSGCKHPAVRIPRYSNAFTTSTITCRYP
jgi:hypothetical protein